jgi:hypothetical protein
LNKSYSAFNAGRRFSLALTTRKKRAVARINPDGWSERVMDKFMSYSEEQIADSLRADIEAIDMTVAELSDYLDNTNNATSIETDDIFVLLYLLLEMRIVRLNIIKMLSRLENQTISRGDRFGILF